MSKTDVPKQMIIGGTIVGVIAMATLIVTASTAAEIQKAKSCPSFPKNAHSMNTGISVVSALVTVGALAVVGFGIYKKASGKKTGAFFYRFSF